MKAFAYLFVMCTFALLGKDSHGQSEGHSQQRFEKLERQVTELTKTIETLRAEIALLKRDLPAPHADAFGKRPPSQFAKQNPLTKTVAATSLEGHWAMFSADYATVGGSTLTFEGDQVTVVTKRPVGEDKINYRVETVEKVGQFRVPGTQKRIDITFSDGTKKSLRFSFKGSELWVGPFGNPFMSEGYRKTPPMIKR